MANYVHAKSDNLDELYFLTIITCKRFPHLQSDSAKQRCVDLWKDISREAQGNLVAYAFLHDHGHVLIRQGLLSYSRWVEKFKRKMNRMLLPGKGSLWQSRFWEHRIRDESDYRCHIEYIHWNPVKHGYVNNAYNYPFSSFFEFVRRNEYPADWLVVDEGGFKGIGGE